MKFSRGWQAAAIFSFAAVLILITTFRVKSVSRSAREIRAGLNEARMALESPEVTDSGKAVADLIRELRESAGKATETNQTALSNITFDPVNLTHIIKNQPVKLASGEGVFADKKIRLENMVLTGDWNADGRTDFAGIISALDDKGTTWYLSVILGGDQPIPLPAVELSENYPITTGLAENKDQTISVIETAWKEQKSLVRDFKVTSEGLEEEK